MAMEDPRSLVLEWLQAGAGYEQGAALYVQVGKTGIWPLCFRAGNTDSNQSFAMSCVSPLD